MPKSLKQKSHSKEKAEVKKGPKHKVAHDPKHVVKHHAEHAAKPEVKHEGEASKRKLIIKTPLAKKLIQVRARRAETSDNVKRVVEERKALEAAGKRIPIIVVKDLVKKYGKKLANDHISFTIYAGERVGIIGANGAGKSTLVEQIIGTTKPTSGSIEYKFAYKKSPQEKMGMQFQTSSYPEGLSVKDVIDFSLEIYSSDIKESEVKNLLRIFQVEDFYKSRAKGLSGGQQQKLNVLLALAHQPELVILDEISTGLDVLAREEIVGYVDKFTREKKMGVILISHHMSEIEHLCDRVIVLSQGKIIKEDSVVNIKKEYGSLNVLMREVIAHELKDIHKERDIKEKEAAKKKRHFWSSGRSRESA